MNHKETFYFAGKCLTLDEHPAFGAEILQAIESGSVNWENFVSLCSDHLILPAIYLKFRDHGLLPYLPKELTKFLSKIHAINLSRNYKILNQLEEISWLLEKNGIYPTLLKGAGNLADNLYGNVGERMMRDIDLLVPEQDYLRAALLLENEGYSTLPHESSDVMKLKHYPSLSRADVFAVVEIHRIPENEQHIKWYNTQVIDAEKRKTDQKASYFVLSDKHKVIHNFIHSQLSHRGHADGIVSLRDLYDLYLLSRRISISTTLPFISCKGKATAYFVFAGKALGLRKKFSANEPLGARMLCLKHDLNHSSALFYHTYRSARYLYEKIVFSYCHQIIESFYSKEMRQWVFDRMKNPHWYKHHVDTYLSFFFPDRKNKNKSTPHLKRRLKYQSHIQK